MYKNLEIALAEEGYLEKKNGDPKYLDSKTENAGYNNYTKYARDLDNAEFFNTAKQSFPWCSVFVSWTFWAAYGMAMARVLTYQPTKSAAAGCTQAAGYYKAHGALFNTPKVGDQIFFVYNGEIEHTGLVYKVDSSKVYTIEGNTNGKAGVVANGGGVFKKEYDIGSSAIYGYGRPDYGIIEDEPEPETVDVTLDILSRGDRGDQVKAVQTLLKDYPGSTIRKVDGIFGSRTKASVIAFQRDKKLTQRSGTVDQATWAALLGAQ